MIFKKPHIIDVEDYEFSTQYASGPAKDDKRKRLYIETLIENGESEVMFRVSHDDEDRWTNNFVEAVEWYNQL